jgi:hypothetical protein
VVIDSLTSALGPDLSTDCQGICRILRRLHTLATHRNVALLLVDRHRFPATVGEPDAVDAALALASAWGLFDRTLTLSRSFGQARPHLYLQDSPRPIILEQHPSLKHGAGAVQR